VIQVLEKYYMFHEQEENINTQAGWKCEKWVLSGVCLTTFS
jgi:hypothetical protein